LGLMGTDLFFGINGFDLMGTDLFFVPLEKNK
jgi:hypothetical protein